MERKMEVENIKLDSCITKKDLNYSYPEELVATEPVAQRRVMWVQLSESDQEKCQWTELPGGLSDLINRIPSGDILVINETKVLQRRVWTKSGLEILFLNKVKSSEEEWEVLCPTRLWKKGTLEYLPDGTALELVQRSGRPQRVRVARPLSDQNDFENWGEPPLPPYILKARAALSKTKLSTSSTSGHVPNTAVQNGSRRTNAKDRVDYQTSWAQYAGSLAAPTASFGFSQTDLLRLSARGVLVARMTLHVGMGTFLPIEADDLSQHKMHSEYVEIPTSTWKAIQDVRSRGGRVWALGTTVTRSLESAAAGILKEASQAQAQAQYNTILNIYNNNEIAFYGQTNLFIQPGFNFRVVDVLLTNFHQPESTLLALVAAFAAPTCNSLCAPASVGLGRLKRAYAWAIEQRFRLFSYGDLSVWERMR